MQLIWLASPALPMGGFSYSEGLKTAVERAGVATETIASDWLSAQLHLNLARGDLAVIARAIPAWRAGDLQAVRSRNQWVLQTRETSELRAQAEQMGRSLLAVVAQPHSVSDAQLEACAQLPPTYPVTFALAVSPLTASVPDCLTAYTGMDPGSSPG